MTVNVGTMQLPVPEDPDAVRTYLNGTHVSGGLWTSLTRASNHDHSGGLNGIQLTATSIPDGSITGAKLDPSVLLPYALVDGSKPFTGTVTMNADQLIRDTLRFGAKPAGVADATFSRTGAGALRVDTHLGVGVNPAAWVAGVNAVEAGGAGGGAWYGYPGFTALGVNTFFDGAFKARASGPAALAILDGGLRVDTAPSVAAGAAQTFTTRLTLDPAGNTGHGVTPAAWGTNHQAVQVGGQAAVWGDKGAVGSSFLSYNEYFDGSTRRAISAAGVCELQFNNQGQLIVNNLAGSGVTAGGAVTLNQRLVLNEAGTLTLTPAAGQPALAANWPGIGVTLGPGTGQPNNVKLHSAYNLELSAGTVVVMPPTDNTHYLGGTSQRWAVVYAASGTIATSSAAVKEGITPLSPAECYQAAKDVRWYEYAYLPPVYTPPEPPPDIAYDAADDNETKAEKKAARDEAEAASKAAHLKMVAETAPARHQRGFVFPAGAESKDEAGGALPPVPDLFGLSDRESTTPQADLATLGCALQEVIRRLEALEAPN